MKKIITITTLTILGLTLLVKSGAMTSFVFFLIAGVIPGTDYAISPNIMLLIILGIVGLAVLHFTASEALYTFANKRINRQKIERKKRMPKRRFGEI